jgi:threonine/homoserine/homoserine lactone efflux protein
LIEYFLSAVVLGVVVAMPPGSVTVVACQRSLQFGFRNSLLFSLGSSLADIFYIVLVWCGVAGVLAANPALKTGLWLVCGALLVGLGVSAILPMLRSGARSGEASPLQANPGATFASGVLVTLTNPMTIVGWLAVAGSFFLLWNDRLPASRAWAPATIALIMLGVQLWFVPLTFIVSRLRHLVGERVKRLLILGANAALVVFGVLALASAVQSLAGA